MKFETINIPNIDKVNKIHIIGDIHYGVRSNSKEWIDITNNYFDNYLIPYLKENTSPNDIAIFMGDIFENRQSLNLLIMYYAREKFEKITNILPVYTFVGNHDIYRIKSNEVTSLYALSGIDNFYFTIKPKIINFGDKKGLLLPWYHDEKEEKKVLEEALKKKVNYVFAHTEMTNAQTSKGSTIYQGHNHQLLNQFDGFFTGHIHWARTYGNVYIVGSAYQITRSDSENSKGIYVLDPHNNKVEFVENNVSPKFKRINLNSIQNLTLQELKEKIYDNFIDLYIDSKIYMNSNLSALIKLIQNSARKIEPIYYENEELENSEEKEQEEIEIKNYDVIDLLKIEIEKRYDDDQNMIKSLKEKTDELYQQVDYKNIEIN